jgi:hypothetical protein
MPRRTAGGTARAAGRITSRATTCVTVGGPTGGELGKPVQRTLWVRDNLDRVGPAYVPAPVVPQLRHGLREVPHRLVERGDVEDVGLDVEAEHRHFDQRQHAADADLVRESWDLGIDPAGCLCRENRVWPANLHPHHARRVRP